MKLYRATLAFTDGPFTVDVWATAPEQVLHMALIDARTLQVGGCHSGTMVGSWVQPMCDLRIEAHCMDDEIEADLLKDYGVKIVERDKAPWEWCFRGTRADLLRMLPNYWGEVENPDSLIQEVSE